MIAQGKGGGGAAPTGAGMSQGKGGGSAPPVRPVPPAAGGPAGNGVIRQGGGKPVVQGGGDLAGLFAGNQGYGGGGRGVVVPEVKQPTRASVPIPTVGTGNPGGGSMSPPPVQPPTTPKMPPGFTAVQGNPNAWQAPDGSIYSPQIGQWLRGSRAGNPQDNGPGGYGSISPQYMADAAAYRAIQQMQPAQPAWQPPALSQAALLARQINEAAIKRRR